MTAGSEYIESPDPPAEIKLKAERPKIARSGMVGGRLDVTLSFAPDARRCRSELHQLSGTLNKALGDRTRATTDAETSTITLSGIQPGQEADAVSNVSTALHDWHEARVARWQKWHDEAPDRAAAKQSAEDELAGVGDAFERAIRGLEA